MKAFVVILFIAAGIALLYFKPWKSPEADTVAAGPPTPEFIRQCYAIMRKEIRKPGKEYCTCLWNRGVRVPSDTLAKPIAQGHAAACE